MLAARGANDGLWDWDLKTNRIYFSSRWKSILGYAEDELGDSPDEWFSRIHTENQEQTRLELSTHLRGLTPNFESEHRIRHKDGSYRWVLTRGLAVRESLNQPPSKNGQGTAKLASTNITAVHETGNLIRMAGSMTDITARKQAEEQLLHDAFHDALTGLPNRALFIDRLGRVIERANRNSTNPYAVLFLDLDRFKVINDSLGHSIGDQLLITLSQRLKAVLRSVDTVARLGGDEFVILLEDLPNPEDATRVAKRFQEELKQAFILEGHEVVVTASIGIVSDTDSYQRPNDVLRDADIAMYRAKARGKDRYEIFDASLRARAIARLEMESNLRAGFEDGELYLNYQPIRSLSTDRLNGFEALLRWKSSFRGSIPPAEFIPVAEETGLIVPIGEWVLREACRQVQIWQRNYPMDPPLSININISGVQFTQPRFLELVEQVLYETGLAPHSLKLEITESVFLENAEHANEILLKLRDLGVQLQIDDFGTGYSSLAYLQHFPIQTIKIDKSFISRMGSKGNGGDDGSGGEIVKTIVALARDLGMDAVAEGVETPEQLAQLKALDCQYGQGYLIARPMDSQAAEILLAQTREGDPVKTIV
jgi:diguanylate cyclase (GGDEF)-like protein/PAS domain S-box-containing protein